MAIEHDNEDENQEGEVSTGRGLSKRSLSDATCQSPNHDLCD